MNAPHEPRGVTIGPGKAERHPLLAAALAPLLGVLLALMFYFATRTPEADWVMVIALAICVTAVGARLVSLLWALRKR